MKASWEKYILNFKQPAGTSRGVLLKKNTYFLHISKKNKKGLGECNLFTGLSFDDKPDYEDRLDWLCKNISLSEHEIRSELKEYPSIIFGWEQALKNLEQEDFIYDKTAFTNSSAKIRINGLIWMGSVDKLKSQIDDKLANNFRCIKLKIGSLNWKEEKKILTEIRKSYSKDTLELRVDANGAFDYKNATELLQELAALDIHSIEQPIKAGRGREMKELCAKTPTPIALDEELIGVLDFNDKKSLLLEIKPQYIILKPSLLGGYKACDEWIKIADENNIGWWVTSALESNVGLNAIAQWTFTKNNPLPQGLGTGQLFTNNTKNPIKQVGEYLIFEK